MTDRAQLLTGEQLTNVHINTVTVHFPRIAQSFNTAVHWILGQQLHPNIVLSPVSLDHCE